MTRIVVAGVEFVVEVMSYAPEPTYAATLPDGRELSVDLDGEDGQLDWKLVVTNGDDHETILLDCAIDAQPETILTEALSRVPRTKRYEVRVIENYGELLLATDDWLEAELFADREATAWEYGLAVYDLVDRTIDYGDRVESLDACQLELDWAAQREETGP